MNDVTLKIEGPKITADKFKKAIDAFFDLITSVGKTVSKEDDSLRWMISVESGSAVIHARPESKAGNPYFESRATSAVVEGVRMLESDTDEEPPGFVERSMEAVKTLASLRDRKGEFVSNVIVSFNGTSTPVTSRSIASVDQVLGIERSEIGSISGQLRSITDHGGVYFYVWDAPGEHRVRCDISEEMLEIAMTAFRRRVAVYGMIHYDRKERPKRITVDDIHIFKTEALPSVNDIIGLFCGGT